MKLSQVYLNAAIKVDGSAFKVTRWYTKAPWCHRGGCWGIANSGNKSDRQFARAKQGFCTAFRPKSKPCFWFGENALLTKEENKKNKDHRVFALLFMSELAKDAKLSCVLIL